MQVVFIHDILEENGKTIKENNLEKKHNIPIGTLVEIIDSGCRLFVVNHSRDCDGTPLYNLCHNTDNIIQHENNFYNHDWINGFSEESLKIIS